MTDWNYSREESHPVAVAGKYRCVIVGVEETVSKSSGKPMIVVTVRPSGSSAKVKSYIVRNDNFNRNMTQFFDAFPDIGEGNFNFIEWVGCLGAAEFGLDDNGYLKVKWWLDPARTVSFPPFEGEIPERQTFTSLDDDEDESELPFM